MHSKTGSSGLTFKSALPNHPEVCTSDPYILKWSIVFGQTVTNNFRITGTNYI